MKDRTREKWTPEEIEKCISMRKMFHPLKEIAAALGRTLAGVMRMLNLHNVKLFPRADWVKLCCEPHTIYDLAEKTGREVCTIQAIKGRLKNKGYPVVRATWTRRK